MTAYRLGLSRVEYPTIDSAGTRRRLQALGALGHSRTAIAQHLGVTGRRVQQMRSDQRRITPRVAADVAALYDALCFVRPIGMGPDLTRMQAQTLGWLPPLAWDDDTIDTPTGLHTIVQFDYADKSSAPIDEIAVERAMRGDRVRLTMAERSEAHARLNRMGLSAREIAERLGTSTRTVVRRRGAAA